LVGDVVETQRSMFVVNYTPRAGNLPVFNVVGSADWAVSDRLHFTNTFNRFRAGERVVSVLMHEYHSIIAYLRVLDNQAIRSSRGYALYGPELVEKMNVAKIAMRARASFLRSITLNTVSSVDVYYPSGNPYLGVPAQLGLRRSNTEFAHYNEGEIVNFLENIDIPDFFLAGLKVFVVNASSPTNVTGHKTSFHTKGAQNESIYLFNSGSTSRHIVEALSLELGNTMGAVFEVFENNLNISASFCPILLNRYTALYNRVHSDNVITTRDNTTMFNFAEDFARLFSGRQKRGLWTGVSNERFRAFLESSFERFDFSKIASRGDINITTAGGIIPELRGVYINNIIRHVVIDSDSVVVRINNLHLGDNTWGNSIGGTMIPLRLWRIMPNGMGVEFPVVGDFTIRIGPVHRDSPPTTVVSSFAMIRVTRVDSSR